ncbi:uncharacterized protein LOC133836488 isoform X2 [Drosophila sulfurigaster albostrigata]|uniref:uncharacterized protein LOC133836488 isoform X2 n=1 Tax=Drosophila sulfurigaster albostrigata TaxID=89887 RepID=UPI002D21B8EF|nr:uncharacterized protein LOC133836488 isoform X2 [Drosophila sulfurigaster albostrigata]
MNLFSRLKRLGAGNKSSVTLPVTVPVPSHNENEEDTPEIYKVIGEDKLPANRNNREASTADMVKEEKFVPDGADEEMLGSGGGDEKLAERRDEVKFIKGDHQNGDAKIDIGNLNGTKPEFTGMSKEELLKYANDPFWVRLRWIFFLGFWAIWVAMLVGAILIIIGAPKCAAPQPLPWYKRGPHAKFGLVGTAKSEDVSLAKKLSATGAIYELPALLTYEVKKADVEAQVKHLVDLYQSSEVKVILDITPNFVGEDSQLVKDALDSAEKRSALIWVNGTGPGQSVPNSWIKVGGNTTAWGDLKGNFVLSQFEPGTYDLKMSSKIVRHELSSALQHLIGLGVQGFRLKNTKFFLINDNLEDETISPIPKDNNMKDYTFYTHTQTTFQPGLGDLLYDYLGVVKNASSEAFLSVAEDIVRPDSYELSQAGGALGIDLPMYGQFMKSVGASQQKKNLVEELQQTFVATRNVSWLQWNFGDIYVDTPTHPSALALFMSLLPGVPIVPVDSIAYTNVTQETYSQIKDLRLSASYMHGELQIFESKKLIAFSRIKSGNPGYFVIFNPTDLLQNSTFSADHKLPDKMTVSYFSENYNDKNNNGTHVAHSAKVNINELQIPAHSAIVLTYVPVKSE